MINKYQKFKAEMTLTRWAAIDVAEKYGLAVNKYADPIERARTGITTEEAREIARSDSGLIWIDVEFVGWTQGDGSGTDGYHVEDYFESSPIRGYFGYLGPDEHGIEPIFQEVK